MGARCHHGKWRVEWSLQMFSRHLVSWWEKSTPVSWQGNVNILGLASCRCGLQPSWLRNLGPGSCHVTSNTAAWSAGQTEEANLGSLVQISYFVHYRMLWLGLDGCLFSMGKCLTWPAVPACLSLALCLCQVLQLEYRAAQWDGQHGSETMPRGPSSCGFRSRWCINMLSHVGHSN